MHASRGGATAAGVGRARGRSPVRTCVGCRQRCPDAELLRVVAADGMLIPDPRRRLPGRGAWVHPDMGCVAAAGRRRAFARAFRLTESPDVLPVTRYLEAAAGR